MVEVSSTRVGPEVEGLARYRRSGRRRGDAGAATADALRDAIFDGALQSGAWLREESLSQVLGVSRTPLREALAQLVEEGLIVRQAGTGARVATVTTEDMVVVYEVRGGLEAIAARTAALRGSPSGRDGLGRLNEEMRGLAARGDGAAFHEVNLSFHAALRDMAGNGYLVRMLTTVETAIRLFGPRTFTPQRMSEVVAEHDAVVDAIRRGDPDAAAGAASSHAMHARRATLQRLLDDPGAPGADAGSPG